MTLSLSQLLRCTGYSPLGATHENDNKLGQTSLSRFSMVIKVMIIVAVLISLNVTGTWLVNQFDMQIFPRHEPLLHALVLGAFVTYVLLMAVPFMPGIELGLALMLLLGAKGAAVVYVCTLVALSLSFLVGRTIPIRLVSRLFRWLHLSQASALLDRLETLNGPERLQFLSQKAPSRIAPLLQKYRYLTIAVALNLPGNALIGGGGGIGLVAGMSRIIGFYEFLVLSAVAIAPVPLLFFTTGR